MPRVQLESRRELSDRRRVVAAMACVRAARVVILCVRRHAVVDGIVERSDRILEPP